MLFSTVSQNSKEASGSQSLIKKVAGCRLIRMSLRPAQVFSCEFYKIFKNTYFEELPQIAANNNSK